MAFTQKTFLGATIRNVQSTIGWNGNSSQVVVTLVEDPTNGDSFLDTAVNTAVYLSFYDFNFFGILMKKEQLNATDGLPTYAVTISDPRFLLEGCQLILSSYNGQTYGVRNLINVYGYLENNLGFGGSRQNETGIPWRLVRNGLNDLINGPTYGLFGGPVTLNGTQYGVDLSELPNELPDYFRVPGPAMSLLEFITFICDYSGFDFFVELRGYNIKIRTVNRFNQPPLGTINDLINNYTGSNLVRGSAGVEARTENTSSFVVGGELTTLYKAQNYTTFWGFDAEGEPLLGQWGLLTFTSGTAPDIHTAYQEVTTYLTLNAAEVSNILGATYYSTTSFELRIAMHGSNGFSNWLSYITKFRPDIADILRLNDIVAPQAFANVNPANPNPLDAFQMARDNILTMVRQARSRDAFNNARLFFSFLLRAGQTYLGRQYMVRVPFVTYATDVDTLKLRTSYETTDAAYINSGENDINNLSDIYWPIFQSQDGRFGSFCHYYQSGVLPDGSTNSLDLSKMSDGQFVVTGTNIFKKTQFGLPQIFFIPEPAVLVKTDPLFYMSTDNSLPLETFANRNINGMNVGVQNQQGGNHPFNPQVFQDVGSVASGLIRARASASVSLKIHPPEAYPSTFHIPLKSNILTYGPWYNQASYGKVHYEQDSSLVPWAFGGFTYLNLAAGAKVQSLSSNMQAQETGYLELAGSPLYSLGDTLQSNGPNVTDISITYGTQGITTTYRFQTYVPRFGQVGKYIQDTFRKQGILSQLHANNARNGLRRALNNAENAVDAARAQLGILANMPPAMRFETPHNSFIAKTNNTRMGATDDNEEYSKNRIGVSTAELGEAMLMTNADDDDEYKKTAVSNLNALMLPVSIYGTGIHMSQMIFNSGVFNDSTIVTAKTYNPYQVYNNDWAFDIVTWGDTYPDDGINTHLYPIIGSTTDEGVLSSLEGTSIRAMALRGPLLLSSWGFDLEGSIVPSDSDYLVNPHKFKTGPVDLLWDENRKVWTSHDILFGVAAADINGGSSGTINVYKDGVDSGWTLTAYNVSDAVVEEDSKVFLAYCMTDNSWKIITNSSGTSESRSGTVVTTLPPATIGGPGDTPGPGAITTPDGGFITPGQGTVTYITVGGQTIVVTVYNYYGITIAPGVYVQLVYNPILQIWTLWNYDITNIYIENIYPPEEAPIKTNIILYGVLGEDAVSEDAGGNAVPVYVTGVDDTVVYVWNIFGTTVTSGTKVAVAWTYQGGLNRYIIIAADCPA